MRGDRYSRLVSWLKIILPMGALALLSTLFLFARAPAPHSTTPYATIEDIARDPRISAPAFAGVTNGGAAVSLVADTIRNDQNRPDAFSITDFRIEMVSPEDVTMLITAATGAFDGRAQQVALEGLARVETSNGYQMETTGLTAALREGRVTTEGALAVRAPFGQLDAGGLEVTEGGARMVFNNGVRLVYLPQIKGIDP